MNLDHRFDKLIFPKIWISDYKISFTTLKYNIQIDRITYTKPQPFVVANHSHSVFEFHYCPSGNGSVIIENNSYAITPGCFFITGPHVLHSQLSPYINPTEEFSFMANIEPVKISKQNENVQIYSDFDDILSTIINNKTYFGEDKHNACQYIKSLYEITSKVSDRQINPSEYWLFIMQTILATAKNIMPLPQNYKKEMYNTIDSKRLSILEDIFRGFHVEMSTEEAADRLGVSVRQLNRITMKHWDMTFKQKYLLSRMEYAPTLLENLNMLTIDEIAQKLNFSSQQYFSNVFKKYYGVSPNEYRKTHKSKM